MENALREPLVSLDERSNNYSEQVFNLLNRNNESAEPAARALVQQNCFHDAYYNQGQRKIEDYRNYPMIESSASMAHMAIEEKLAERLTQDISGMDLQDYLAYEKELKKVDFEFHSEAIEDQEFAQERKTYISSKAFPQSYREASASEWRERTNETIQPISEQLGEIDPKGVIGGEYHLGAVQLLIDIYQGESQSSSELKALCDRMRTQLPDYQPITPERNEIVSTLNSVENQKYWTDKACEITARAIQWMVRTETSDSMENDGLEDKDLEENEDKALK